MCKCVPLNVKKSLIHVMYMRDSASVMDFWCQIDFLKFNSFLQNQFKKLN